MTGELRQRGNVWWIRYYRRGRRFEESSRSTSREQAEALLSERLRTAPPPATPRAARVRPDKLYVIQMGAGGPIKIGITNSIRQRLAGLQTASYIPLTLVSVLETQAARSLERGLHMLLASERESGEWFRPSEKTLAVLRRYELIP